MCPQPWHVLYVRSNYEKRVAIFLSTHAVEHYLPLYSERVRWSDRMVITERPLFSGYVFARFPHPQRVSVISAPGVIRDLGDSEQNMVYDTELARIRAGVESGILIRPHSGLEVGTRVHVKRGIFEGAEGMVKELRSRCQVVLTLTTINRSFSFECSIEDITVLKTKQVALPHIPSAADLHPKNRTDLTTKS